MLCNFLNAQVKEGALSVVRTNETPIDYRESIFQYVLTY